MGAVEDGRLVSLRPDADHPPGTTFLEREDVPFGFSYSTPWPFLQAAEPVVEPYGDAWHDREILDEIARRAGIGGFLAGPLARLSRPVLWLQRHGLPRLTPWMVSDLLIRIGPYGDQFGLRRGLHRARLRTEPHGVLLADHAPTGIRRKVVRRRKGLVRLDAPEVAAELERLAHTARKTDPDLPLRLIGLQENRSQNSWMYNSPTLMRGSRRHAARINPDAAADAGVQDGAQVRITSAHGEIVTEARCTDEVGRGTVAVPHGWGHGDGGWQLANRAGGANVNQLASVQLGDIEPVAGDALLNGIPVRIAPA